MGLFRKKDDNAEQLRTMQEQLEAMAERLDRADAENRRLHDIVSTPPPEPPPPPPAPERTVEQIEQDLIDKMEALAAAVVEQRDRLADLAVVASAVQVDEDVRSQVSQIAERMTALDGRITQVSTELANQVDELGGDLDSLQRAAEQLDDITSGQTRLANEQARYEIQFRQDLAELADRLRRPGAT